MKTIHLLCNSHLDPVWLWEWEEGAAEAISTFRVAADFCEQYDGFIFNHNEAILYKWVEEYEPQLFERIRKLVKEGKWRIMGGWFLQPDCNMPSGESLVRQILTGKNYFLEKFGANPTTAINFDPFGHSRGLVQILKKSGYDSYVFCRPVENACPLPADDFLWVGFDGSKVIGHRGYANYNSRRGQAANKIKTWMEENETKNEGLILWGIGNHGGGPSRIDMGNIENLMKSTDSFKIIHSTAEDYFMDLISSGAKLVEVEKDLNPFAVGCYTSQVRVKQKHRLLENEIYMLEKMAAWASIHGLLEYPREELNSALYDLMVSEFHDILPGSSIQTVEETSLRILEHGLEIVSRLKARTFFALARGQEKAKEGEIPVLVYNPHPFKVDGIFECEFILCDKNFKDEYTMPTVYKNGEMIHSQPEKELSSLNLDWRKRVAFKTELEPFSMNRFDVRLEVMQNKPQLGMVAEDGRFTFKNSRMQVIVNCGTGLIDSYIIDGIEYFKENAFMPLVLDDNEDSWGMRVNSYRNVAGAFELMSKEEGTKYSGVKRNILESVRVIEDGAVRCVVEAVLKYGSSSMCLTYRLPKQGTEIQVSLRVNWSERDKMLKLSIPTNLKSSKYIGQVAYGHQELPSDGREAVAQKWTAAISGDEKMAVTCINDGVYGSDFCNGEIRISLVRSPAYSSHQVLDREMLPQDRFINRIDQGERLYNFWINAGEKGHRLGSVDREALALSEKPFVLSFFPSGLDGKITGKIELTDNSVLMTAFKKAEKSEDYIIRLFEPTGSERSTMIRIPHLNVEEEICLKGFEIKTLRLDLRNGSITETGLMES